MHTISKEDFVGNLKDPDYKVKLRVKEYTEAIRQYGYESSVDIMSYNDASQLSYNDASQFGHASITVTITKSPEHNPIMAYADIDFLHRKANKLINFDNAMSLPHPDMFDSINVDELITEYKIAIWLY